MTKLGPLTSQALGRSPYDIVVPGTGEPDPHQPPQDYDERGRPINPETKRINRGIVRSHNEVMHVIGVAEPDSGFLAADIEAERRRIQKIYEEQIGRQLMNMGRIMGIAGVWGVNALRQRILLYREYSGTPFHQLLRHEADRRPIGRVFMTGLPIFVLSHTIRQLATSTRDFHRSFWKRSALQFVRLHFQIFLFLQRMAIIPAYPWFPSLLYFIPFSSASPIGPPPPLPATLSARSLALWAARAAFNMAPVAAFYSYTTLWSFVTQHIYEAVYDLLPQPLNFRLFRRPVDLRPLDGADQDSRRDGVDGLPDDVPVSAVLGEETATAVDADADADADAPQPTDGPQPMPAPPSPTAVRRNTVSSRSGDDGYASEEEEFELSATLISFDVEAADMADNAPNAWSAELRQSSGSMGGGGGGGRPADDGSGGGAGGGGGGEFGDGEFGGGDGGAGGAGLFDNYAGGGGGGGLAALEPTYTDNALTRLPTAIAADVLTVVLTSMLVAPYEAFIIRLVARAYRLRRGLPVDDLHGLLLWGSSSSGGGGGGHRLSWTGINNFFGVCLMHLTIESTCWLASTAIAVVYRGSDPRWGFWRSLREKLGYGPNKDGEGDECE